MQWMMQSFFVLIKWTQRQKIIIMISTDVIINCWAFDQHSEFARPSIGSCDLVGGVNWWPRLLLNVRFTCLGSRHSEKYSENIMKNILKIFTCLGFKHSQYSEGSWRFSSPWMNTSMFKCDWTGFYSEHPPKKVIWLNVKYPVGFWPPLRIPPEPGLDRTFGLHHLGLGPWPYGASPGGNSSRY